MKPQQLRTFLAVAEHRSIHAAARALFVSQPAVTRTMRELERDLDVPLLRRSISGVELTDRSMRPSTASFSHPARSSAQNPVSTIAAPGASG